MVFQLTQKIIYLFFSFNQLLFLHFVEKTKAKLINSKNIYIMNVYWFYLYKFIDFLKFIFNNYYYFCCMFFFNFN